MQSQFQPKKSVHPLLQGPARPWVNSRLVRPEACAFVWGMACCRQMAPVIRSNQPGRMTRQWLVMLSLTAGLFCSSGTAQTAAAPKPEPAAVTPETSTSTPATTAAVKPFFKLEGADQNATTGGKPRLSGEEFNATVAAALVAALKKPDDKSPDFTAVWAALIAVAGVVASAFFSHVIANNAIKAARAENVFKAQEEREKARIDAALAYTAKMLDLEYRQLEKFYAPLLARTQQCRGINEKLTLYLYNKSPKNQYDWKPDDKGVNRLQVKGDDGKMGDFRLLNQLPTLKEDPVALALVDQILTIGGEMVGIIRQHNGLASVDKSMDPVYGRFLAHYAIIKLERDKLKAADCSTIAHAPGTHGDAYYPRPLDDLILQEYETTRRNIKKYKDMSEKALKWLEEIAP